MEENRADELLSERIAHVGQVSAGLHGQRARRLDLDGGHLTAGKLSDDVDLSSAPFLAKMVEHDAGHGPFGAKLRDDERLQQTTEEIVVRQDAVVIDSGQRRELGRVHEA